MDYIGSKVKINDWLFGIIKNATGEAKGKTFLDACSGSGAVSRYASQSGYKVVANDLMRFPSVIANGSIGLSDNQLKQATKEIKKLNELRGINGYFYNNFCDESNPPRLYFTSYNARRIDRIRKEIDTIDDSKVRDYILYCGLEAMSSVSNTAGVQAAFLKKFKDRANGKFKLSPENVVSGECSAFSTNILSLLEDKTFRNRFEENILYIDPPYNQRQYGPNYHLYETFVRYDNPQPSGKTGLRDWKNECSSDFCTKKKCLAFLKKIVDTTTAEFIFVSYNSDGLLKRDDIETTFPNVVVHEKDQRRYKADASKDREYNNEKLMEYVFEIHN